MKKLYILIALVSFGFCSVMATPIHNKVEEAPCSTRTEIFVNGQFIGTHTEYNYSLSCSGQANFEVHLEFVPVLA